MSLQALERPSLCGANGFAQLRAAKRDMAQALAQRDFKRVRQLDATCAVLVDKLIHANRDEPELLRVAMVDLKNQYADMIHHCQQHASAGSA